MREGILHQPGTIYQCYKHVQILYLVCTLFQLLNDFFLQPNHYKLESYNALYSSLHRLNLYSLFKEKCIEWSKRTVLHAVVFFLLFYLGSDEHTAVSIKSRFWQLQKVTNNEGKMLITCLLSYSDFFNS